MKELIKPNSQTEDYNTILPDCEGNTYICFRHACACFGPTGSNAEIENNEDITF